jgi:hypothetical protein
LVPAVGTTARAVPSSVVPQTASPTVAPVRSPTVPEYRVNGRKQGSGSWNESRVTVTSKVSSPAVTAAVSEYPTVSSGYTNNEPASSDTCHSDGRAP